jgi:hypothetical protein
MIINTGGRDIVIDKLSVRGQEVEWTDVFYCVTTDSISQDLPFQSTAPTADSTVAITGAPHTPYALDGTSSDLTLQSGKTLLLYINSPDSITINDIGLTVAITVFTSQAMYYKETNVQAV